MLPCNAFKQRDPVISNVLYLFYLSKILDLMDTFFIIAGKKFRQLSILHVYHHISVLFVSKRTTILFFYVYFMTE
jgi:elongation of very long chain fatty acids protein 4